MSMSVGVLYAHTLFTGQRERQTDRQTDRETERQRDGERERWRESERERHVEYVQNHYFYFYKEYDRCLVQSISGIHLGNNYSVLTR